MTRFVAVIILIVAGYLIFRHILRMFTQETRERSEEGGFRNQEQTNTKEEEYARILGVTDQDSPTTIRTKYRELLAKYHPDKVQHLGMEFQEMAERKTKAIMEAYEFFRKREHL